MARRSRTIWTSLHSAEHDVSGPLGAHTQENFGRLLGVPTGTLRQWEQGRRKPTGAARVLLSQI